jgi:hypothetical protein
VFIAAFMVNQCYSHMGMVMSVCWHSVLGIPNSGQEDCDTGDHDVYFLGDEDWANLLHPDVVAIFSHLAQIALTSLKCFA